MVYRKYTAQQMIDAIIFAKGMKTIAAKKLGTSFRTVEKYMAEYPSVQKAFDDAQETTGDMVELALLNQVQKGDTTAIIFALKTRYRARGYTEKLDIDVSIPQLKEFIAALQKTGQQPQEFMQRVIERAQQEHVH